MLLPLLLALATQVQDTAHIIVVATTDVHGQATAWNYTADSAFPGGLTRAARIVDSLKARYPGQVVTLDAGDLIQGNPFATYFSRVAPRDPHPIFDAMTAIGYDAATPGNHDFDWGMPFLRRALRGATFPYVSGNIYSLPGDTLAFPSFVVLRRGSVRVGITGFTTQAAMIGHRGQSGEHTRVASIRESSPGVLRSLKNQADLSIVLLHSGITGSPDDSAATGGDDAGLALSQGPARPDLVIAGHTHLSIADTILNGVHFVQPPPQARGVSVVHVWLQRSANGWTPFRIAGELVPLDRVEPLTAVVRRLTSEHASVRQWTAQVLGNASADMLTTTARAEPSVIAQYINEVQRKRAGTDLSTTPIFTTDAGFSAGEITVAKVLRLYPYENTLRAIRITGEQLKAFLEHSARYFVAEQGRVTLDSRVPGYTVDVVSGAEYVIDLRLPRGSRIRELTVRGKPVEPTDQFTMAINSFRQGGGGGYNMLAASPVIYDRGENIRDLLIGDIRARGVIDARDFATRNWRIVPEEMARSARRLFAPTPDPVRPPPPRDTTILRIFAMGDFHGALFPQVRSWSRGRPVGGMPAIKRLMDSLTSACDCADLRLDAGDQMQGTLASNLEFGRSTIAAMNLLGIDAAVVGNHDFDWSVDTLLRRMADARYSWLIANVVDSATGKRPDWAVPYRVLTAGRLRVGVIGYTTPETKEIVRGDLLKGLRFSGPESLTEPLAQLREQNPDFVILIAHEGAACQQNELASCSGAIIDLARRLDSTRVDLIVAGHQHQRALVRVNGINIIQTGSNGGDIGVIDVIRTLVGSREVHTRLSTVFADSIGADSAMARLVEGFRQRSDSLAQRVVATMKTPAARSGRQYPLANLVADAQRNALRTDFAMMNNGGVRTGLPAGPVNYSQVFEVSPFGNELVRIRLTGRDMRNVLEQALEDGGPRVHISGLRVTWDNSRPAGRRIRDLRLLNGRRLDDRTTYTLAVSDYLAGGKDGFSMLHALSFEHTGVVDTDALVNYLRRLPQPVDLPVEHRFQAVRR